MSLLTDAELARAAYPALENVPSHWLTGRNRRVADAATEVALKAVAEYLSIDTCGHPHRLPMYECPIRLREAILALREGKMPGEE